MKAKISEISNIKEWESDLNRFEHTIFVTPKWLEAFRDSTKIPVYLNFNFDNETVGKVAGLKLESDCTRLRNLFFYSSPSVHKSNTGIFDTVINELIGYAASNRFNRLIVRSYDSPFLFESNNRDFKVNTDDEYLIDLSKSMEEIQKGFNRLTMRKVKKAKNSGAAVFEEDSPALIDRLVLLLEETRSIRLSKGYEYYSYFYFPYLDKDKLNKLLANGAGKIFFVKIGDNINCVLFVLIHNRRAYNLLIGSSSESYNLGVASYIHYYAVIRLKELGYEYYNLGRIPDDSSGPGLIFFKTSLGAKTARCMGGSTNYLKFPYKCLNPLLDIGRKMPEYSIVRAIKKFV